jgi:hypothetical protein
MAHYAFLDDNNVVTEVITGIDETELIEGLEPEIWYGNFRGQTCKRTSYNTLSNQHLNGGTPFRKNYASISFTYDADKDAFIPPKIFNSWVLDENTFNWVPPIPVPDSGNWIWNEEIQNWSEHDAQ